ncbi:MAG: hypothetical protein IJM21_12520 [Clostridia bacterium]|nr:hypothetical protein [Clostridia bacterium]
MPKNVQFGGGAPKQEPSVNQKARTDYSLPILGDDDFSGAPRDADPLKTYSLKILRGRTITFLLAAVNILAIAVWMVLSLLGNGTLWWILVYGLGMLACCVFLFFGKETARKFFAIPAVMIGVPVAFSLLINPSGTPMFLKTSYQLAVQIVSAALLYFLPPVSAFFTASPKAVRRALDHEWEKSPPKTADGPAETGGDKPETP